MAIPEPILKTPENLLEQNKATTPNTIAPVNTFATPALNAKTGGMGQTPVAPIGGGVPPGPVTTPGGVPPLEIPEVAVKGGQIPQKIDEEVAVKGGQVPDKIDLEGPFGVKAGQEVQKVDTGEFGVKAKSDVKGAFTIENPITGEVEDFDTQEKADKARQKFAADAEKLKIEKQRLGQTDDIIDNLMSFIKDITDPNTKDPIREAQFNYNVATMGVINAAQSDAMILKLKQQGIEGAGAGNALLLNLARSQGKNVSDMVGSINVESAKRIEEWNRIGPQLAQQALTNALNYKVGKYNFGVAQIQFSKDIGITDPNVYKQIGAANGLNISDKAASDFAKLVASDIEADNIKVNRELLGHYQGIERDLEGLVPGLNIYGSAFVGLDKEKQADLSDRIQQVNGLLNQNKVEEARALLLETQGLYPNSVKGDYSKWNPRDFRTIEGLISQNKVKIEIDNLVTQGDRLGAMELWKDSVMDPLAIDEDFSKLRETVTDDRHARILEAAGLESDPVTEDEKQDYLAADAIMGISPTSTEKIFDSIYANSAGDPDMRAFLMTPEGANLTRAWINDVGNGAFKFDENGELIPDPDRQLPPWNDDSLNSHYYSDWPLAGTFNPDTGELDISYDGYNPLEGGDNIMQSDGSYTAYTEEINKAWESYTKQSENPVSRKQWFNDVKPTWDGNQLVMNGDAKTRDDKIGDKSTGDIVNIVADFSNKNDSEVSDVIFPKGVFDETVYKGLVDNGVIKKVTSPKELTDDVIQAILDDPSSKNIIDINGSPFIINDKAGSFVDDRKDKNGNVIWPNLSKELGKTTNMAFISPLSDPSFITGGGSPREDELFYLILEGPNQGKVVDLAGDKIISMEDFNSLERTTEESKELLRKRNAGELPTGGTAGGTGDVNLLDNSGIITDGSVGGSGGGGNFGIS